MIQLTKPYSNNLHSHPARPGARAPSTRSAVQSAPLYGGTDAVTADIGFGEFEPHPPDQSCRSPSEAAGAASASVAWRLAHALATMPPVVDSTRTGEIGRLLSASAITRQVTEVEERSPLPTTSSACGELAETPQGRSPRRTF